MRAGRRVIRHLNGLNIAGAAQDHFAFAILRGFLGIGRDEFAGGPRNRAEDVLDPRKRLGVVEFTGDDQRCVVGLVILVIEVLEALDRHVLDIAAGANRRAAIAVPQVGGGHNALKQDAGGGIFTHLEFVAHHGHFAIEIGARDAGVNHAVRLEFEREAQILVRGGHGFEVVGAVVIG